MKSKGFIFDYSKCVGCHACLVGCYNENKTNPPISWRQINSFNQKKIPLAGFVSLSIACNHCIDAPCHKNCPAKAYKIDETTGAIIHIPENCIGCRYCTWTCPFDAPKYNSQKGIVEKCYLCNHKVEKGLKPACVIQCPTGALTFELIDEIKNNEVYGIPNTIYKPRIRTINSTVVKNIPEMDRIISGIDNPQELTLGKRPNDKIHAVEEWPLILFTLIYSFLSGWIFAFTKESSSPNNYIFMLLGLLGIIFSAFHLGKPFRAQRSILNLKNSWLSKEIILSGLFISSSFIFLFISRTTLILVITVLLSMLFLFSVEMVYSLTEKKFKTIIHSANTLLTAILFGLFFTNNYKLFVAILVVKALLYLFRKKDDETIYKPIKSTVTALRFIIGIIFPLAMVFFQKPINDSTVLICIILGEVIDRFEFYDDIYINSPSKILYHQFENEMKISEKNQSNDLNTSI